jgi:ribosomal protein S18 acetylase RimI-like enzyme
MTIELRSMTIEDYDQVFALWKATEGIGLSAADERPAIAAYLQRNPGMSFVASDKDRIVGAALCGHDGRRGYLHHLAVAPSHRGKGLGRVLAAKCLAAVSGHGIGKCHLFVFAGNAAALSFWKHVGWTQRVDIVVMSRNLPDGGERGVFRVNDASRKEGSPSLKSRQA